MSVHAKLGPSGRARWARCPGSVREEAKFPDVSGESAIDGTHTHTLIEHCVKASLMDPSAMVGVEMTDHEGAFVVDEDRAERARVAIDYVRQRVAECGGLAQVISESQTNPEKLTGRSDLFGTADIQIRGLDFIEIVDYKDGMGIVEAEGNMQLEQYAIGVLAEMPNVAPETEVHMTIVQPRLRVRNMEPVTKWIVPAATLLKRVPILIAEAAATDNPDAPLVPGETQCKFCKAKGSCPALASEAMREIGVMFQPVSVTNPLDVAQQAADKDPSSMSDQQIKQILEAAPLVRQLLEATEAEALRRLETKEIPGLKLVTGRGSRGWALPDDEMAKKLVMMGVPKGAVYETKLVSPAKAEKLEWEKRDGTRVTLTKKQLERLDAEYVKKSTGKLTVVLESDPRPAVKMNVSHLFSAVETSVSAEPLTPVADSLPSWLTGV